MINVLAIGHSHMRSIEFALNAGHTAGGRLQVDRVRLRDPKYSPTLIEKTSGQEEDLSERFQLNHALVQEIRSQLPGKHYCLLFIEGNAHNTLGLLKHPRHFDFVLSERPGLPLAQDAEVIAEQFVREALANRLTSTFQIMKELRNVIDKPIVYAESPPPIANSDHIRAHPNVFREKIKERGVAPRWLRYKLWRIHSELVKQIGDSFGFHYLPVPDELMNSNGFMIPEAWRNDPVHANHIYGEHLLNQFADWANNLGKSNGYSKQS